MTFEENFDLGLILMRKFDLGLQILVRYISFKEKQISEVETEASWAKLDPEMVLRATLFARVIQQLDRWACRRRLRTAAVSGDVKRRAECASLGPGLKHPSLPSLTQAAKRRADAPHAVL